jgi:putative Holliday junction resolvase
MKLLGIDFGTKNIGLAMTDEGGEIAFPFKTLHKNAISEIVEICQQEKIEKIIIGLPINLQGDKTASTTAVEVFIKELKEKIDLPIQTVDERLTTVQAHKIGANKKSADKVSAQILLQNYIDKNN